MRRHSRHHYRLGAPEVGADLAPVTPAAPALPSRSGGGLLTPKTGDMLVGAGLLTALGVIGYYVYKGGDISELWSRLTSSAAGPRLSPGGHALPPDRPSKPVTGSVGTIYGSTLPSGIFNYIPKGLPSGQGGTGTAGSSRPTVDMY